MCSTFIARRVRLRRTPTSSCPLENNSGNARRWSFQQGQITDWRWRAATSEPDALLFATRSGKPLSPNNVLRRSVFPACEALGLPHATWLTFRRTYSSWSHDKGVPGKVVAQLMGHANVDTTLNVYTQVLDDSLRVAVEKVGDELFTIVHQPEGAGSLNH